MLYFEYNKFGGKHGTQDFRRMHFLRRVRGGLPRQRDKRGRRQICSRSRRLHRLRRVRGRVPDGRCQSGLSKFDTGAAFAALFFA